MPYSGWTEITWSFCVDALIPESVSFYLQPNINSGWWMGTLEQLDNLQCHLWRWGDNPVAWLWQPGSTWWWCPMHWLWLRNKSLWDRCLPRLVLVTLHSILRHPQRSYRVETTLIVLQVKASFSAVFMTHITFCVWRGLRKMKLNKPRPNLDRSNSCQ